MENNGILAHIRGAIIADGSKQLPDAELAEDVLQPVEIDAGDPGRVRIYYQRQRVKKGKHSHWFWLAVKAEKVESL